LTNWLATFTNRDRREEVKAMNEWDDINDGLRRLEANEMIERKTGMSAADFRALYHDNPEAVDRLIDQLILGPAHLENR
jgi:SUMO ligase MMS21 Smc5/6 complex component